MLALRAKDIHAAHSPASIRERMEENLHREGYLGDFLLGAIDGSVTTFAVVAGVAGAGLPSGVAVILGLANLVADGFSMAAGNYQKARSDLELIAKARRMEEDHIASVPDGEREEVRQIFAGKGFSGRLLEHVVDTITSDRDRWIDVMLTEELGLRREAPDPFKTAGVTFAAFVAVGIVPLLPYIVPSELGNGPCFLASTAATLASFFAVGVLKGRLRHRPWFRSGLETLLVGGSAAGLAFAIGAGLRNFLRLPAF